MTATWKTKDGMRRVRRDAVTMEEAIAAAEGLADEIGAQAEIAANLMGVTVAEAREAIEAAARAKPKLRDTIRLRERVLEAPGGGARQVVVVEKRPMRRMIGRP